MPTIGPKSSPLKAPIAQSPAAVKKVSPVMIQPKAPPPKSQPKAVVFDPEDVIDMEEPELEVTKSNLSTGEEEKLVVKENGEKKVVQAASAPVVAAPTPVKFAPARRNPNAPAPLSGPSPTLKPLTTKPA